LLDGDLVRGSTRGSFENAVLDKMRDAVQFGRLTSRTDAVKKAERRRTDSGHSVSKNGQAVFKAGFFDLIFH
jgi:hypothetical protein